MNGSKKGHAEADMRAAPSANKMHIVTEKHLMQAVEQNLLGAACGIIQYNILLHRYYLVIMSE